MNPTNSSSNLNQNQTNNKRYVILTYVVEFDKVHYPLPLNFEDSPDIDHMKGNLNIK
jgi:coiled-coil domain-containing protein 61